MNIELLGLLNDIDLYGKMNNTGALEQIKPMKKEAVIKVHHYKIIEPKDSKAKKLFYRTNVITEEGKRLAIRSSTLEGLYEKLYKFYFIDVIPTIESFYDDWIEYRKSQNIAFKSICRYHNYWNKYYKNDVIVTKKLNKVTGLDLETFFHTQIKLHQMTKKELLNMKGILKGIYEYAVKQKTISTNPFIEADIKTTGCIPPTKHTNESRFYSLEELPLMYAMLNKEILAHIDCTDMYGIFLLFTKGLRIAELAALKLCDIDFNTKQLYVHRMETVLEDDNKKPYMTVVDYGKQKSEYAIRWLDLTDLEIDLIHKVIAINTRCGYADDDFLFLDSQGRTKVREFDNRIRKMCNKIGIEEKSAHDIRRTVASKLAYENFTIEYIKNYLGHSDISTTRSYIYDLRTKTENKDLLNKSMSDVVFI